MEVSSQQVILPRISTMDLEKVTSFSFPLTPPTTPPKAGPTYYISSSPNPPSPTIIINAPKPWYSSKGFTAVVVALLSFFAFSIHQLSPLIGSTASTVRNFGEVVGSVANVGNAFGSSISQTTRISSGIADGVGDVWCAVLGGKRCGAAPTEALNVTEPNDIVSPVGSNALMEGAKIVGTLKHLALVKTNLSAASDVLYLSEYLSEAPRIQHHSSIWSERLRTASPDFDKNVQGRNAALRGTFAVLQGLIDQYNTVVLVSNSASSILDSPFTSRRARQELLNDELVHMARYTFLNYDNAKHQLRELRLNSQSLYATGQRVLGPARKQLNMLRKFRLLHPVWKGVCALGFCPSLVELDWTIELLNGVIGTLDVHTNDAAALAQVAQDLIGDLDMFMSAFNATARVTWDPKTGNITVGQKHNPWLTLQRLEPGLSELSVRLKDLPSLN